MAGKVREFIEATLQSLSSDLSWLCNVRYELCVSCTYCLQSTDQCVKHSSERCTHDDCLHLLPVLPNEELICPKSFCDETVKVHGLEKWFHKAETDEPKLEQLAPKGPHTVGVFTPSVPAGGALDQPLSLKPGTPSSDDLLLIAVELGPSWKMLGRALHLPENVLEEIEEDERRPFDKCYGVLRKWTEAFGSAATYQDLARALQHPIVGLSKLATKYCNLCRDTLLDENVKVVAPQVPDASSSSLTVFVSYQWDLQDSVEIIKNKIEESGLQCWMSSGEMGGDNTLLAKKDAEIQACKVFVCCVTEKYIHLEACQREAMLADHLRKPIIVLLFGDISWSSDAQLSAIFARLPYIRIAEKGAPIDDSVFEQLLKKIKESVAT